MPEQIKLRFTDEEVRTYPLIAEGKTFWLVEDQNKKTRKVFKDEATRVADDREAVE